MINPQWEFNPIIIIRMFFVVTLFQQDYLHYSALTGILEDDMWIIDSGASRHMTGDQVRLLI
jgi:hypothetical protein